MKTNLLVMPEEHKEPKPHERSMARAHDAKVHATDQWVRGEITSKKHSAIHKRADMVIRKKGKL